MYFLMTMAACAVFKCRSNGLGVPQAGISSEGARDAKCDVPPLEQQQHLYCMAMQHTSPQLSVGSAASVLCALSAPTQRRLGDYVALLSDSNDKDHCAAMHLRAFHDGVQGDLLRSVDPTDAAKSGFGDSNAAFAWSASRRASAPSTLAHLAGSTSDAPCSECVAGCSRQCIHEQGRRQRQELRGRSAKLPSCSTGHHCPAVVGVPPTLPHHPECSAHNPRKRAHRTCTEVASPKASACASSLGGF